MKTGAASECDRLEKIIINCRMHRLFSADIHRRLGRCDGGAGAIAEYHSKVHMHNESNNMLNVDV